jgi:hypothetical protein
LTGEILWLVSFCVWWRFVKVTLNGWRRFVAGDVWRLAMFCRSDVLVGVMFCCHGDVLNGG